MVGPWPPGPGAAPSGAPAPGPGRIENKNNILDLGMSRF